jgi:hypothetical protein
MSNNSNDLTDKFERARGLLDPGQLVSVIDLQTDLVHLPMVNRHTTGKKNLNIRAESDIQVWKYFQTEQLYDTRRVTLEHFHLFEWFPLSPGKYHTKQASQARHEAHQMLVHDPLRGCYYDPYGKARMVDGGIGNVRLRPRQIAGEPHYFMTASSSGICHEGFPVLIPRRFYGPIKSRILEEGAVPVTLSGEMRYIAEDTLPFFEKRRDVPLLYLHVDNLEELPPRKEITRYAVSVAVSFAGEFNREQGVYITFATFDPAGSKSLTKARTWMETTYIEDIYNGVIITDFDEVNPKLTNVVFGLPDLMAGRLDQTRVKGFLQKYGYNPDRVVQNFFFIYKMINTQGGAYIEGDVNINRGDFIGRDNIIKKP